MEVDPLSVVGRTNYYSNHLSILDPEAAERGARALAKNHQWAGYATLGNVSWRQGNMAEALAFFLQAYAYDPLDRYSNQFMVFNFCLLGMVTEARRVSDVTLIDAEALCGDLTAALELQERLILLDPDDPNLVQGLATLHFLNNQPEQALTIFREIAEGLGSRVMMSGGYSVRDQLQLAWLLQQSGKPDAASRELAKIDRDLESRAGTPLGIYANITWDRGLRAWLDGDRDTALRYFRKAQDEGHRFWQAFENPMLMPLRDDPEFMLLRAELDALLDIERDKALRLICLDNPVPDYWQPLAETCVDTVKAESEVSSI